MSTIVNLVDYVEGDKRNPINFSLRPKWTITAMVCLWSGTLCIPNAYTFMSSPRLVFQHQLRQHIIWASNR
jgi:hypothetical protein